MHVPPLAVFGNLAINFSRLESLSIKTGLLSVVAAELFFFKTKDMLFVLMFFESIQFYVFNIT